MASHTNQDFIRGDAPSQRRILTISGIAAFLVGTLVILLVVVVYPRATAPEGTRFSLVVPTLGPGVTPGSKILLRGAPIGKVVTVTALDDGDVELLLAVDGDGIGVLTDTLTVDFRPENYFGVSAIYLSSQPGGSTIREGQVITRTESPDYTMSTMLETGSLVIDGTLTGDVIASLDKVMRYANGLSPLIRSGIIFADQVAKTQQQVPSVHLQRINALLREFPAFGQGAADALYSIAGSVYNSAPAGEPITPDRALLDSTDETLALLGSDLFGAAGKLLASHGDELTPLTQVLAQLTDPIPGMLGGAGTFADIDELITRLDGAFTGGPENKTLQVRLILDNLPAMAGPMAATGVTAPKTQGGK
ncbi:MlaD family protein [Rhodococcus qingshengii]|uniref:mammalian cell entry protein n=1 Tax=Rhodococcus qingshengii TaxID=334542 RepID=UPI0036D898BB